MAPVQGEGGGNRQRLDQWLVQSGDFVSREKARAAVLAGQVSVDGRTVTKAGAAVDPGAQVVVASGPRFVSRGGDKLAGALADLSVEVEGLVALDAGAATGGFADCLLQHGARHVIAVDVGYGQLAWALRQDPRVTVIERQNLRYLTPELLGQRLPTGVGYPEFVTLDLSFIGLDKVYPAVHRLLPQGGRVLALVKPQFEVGPQHVGKRGVVRQPALHVAAVFQAARGAQAAGFRVDGVTYSHLKGPEGNIEYFLLLTALTAGQGLVQGERRQLEKTGQDDEDDAEAEAAAEALRQEIDRVVEAAWAALGA
jgi:23S rRNA (cytidine1920-2'-O)/16S rRNA (cytidine1409-2'-O)-methyltransferase